MYGHRPPGPPPPFQRVSSAPPHPVVQQGPLPVQPHVGNQSGQPVYQHAPPPPPPHAPVQQGSQVHGGMLKVGQSYLHPPPQFHGSVPLPHLYPSSNHNSIYSPHFLQTPPPLPPLGPHTENLRTPPPPPPSSGQTQYRTLGLSEPGGVQGLHHVQLPPPPPRPQLSNPPPATSSYVGTAPFEYFLHPTLGASHMPTMAPPPPPPLPSSPPPLPPSPPPPPSPLPRSGTSPVPIMDASHLPSISGSDKVCGSQSQIVTSANHTRDNATMSDSSINCVESAGSPTASNAKDGFLDKENIILRPPESQSYSPADCDMEMEDDIQVHQSLGELNPERVIIRDELDVDEKLTAPEDPPVYTLSVSGYSGPAAHGGVSESRSDRINLGKPSPFVTGGSSVSNASAGSGDNDAGKPSGGSSVSNASVGSGDNDAGKPSGQHSIGDNPFSLLQVYASDDNSTDNSEPCLDDPVSVSSPFTVGGSNLNIDPSHNLEPDVASKSPYKDVSESRSLFQETLASSPSSTSIKDPDLSLGSNLNVENTALSSVPGLLAVKSDEQRAGITKSINHSTSKDYVKKEDAALDGVNVSDILESGNSHSKDGKCVSPQIKVDEFGRLVRKEDSDSESDDFRSKRRRGRKSRSRSRSVSPRDKRRRSRSRSVSPRDKRRRRRSRSRSWSPKRRRSRSRSPINRRGNDYGSEKMKRGKDHIPYCMDFSRGKCRRGASCRFLHPEFDKTAGSRRHKSKNQKEETSPSLNHEKVLDIQISEKYERSIETDTQVPKSRQSEEERAEQTSRSDNDNRHKLVDTHQPFSGPAKSLSEPEDTAEHVLSSVAVFQKAGHIPRQGDGCSTSDSMGHLFSSDNSSSQLPPPPLSQSMNAPSMAQLSNDYNLMQPTASLPYQPAYQAPIPSQQPRFSMPPNSTWISPPPPPLAVNHSIVKEAVAIPGYPQFQQNHLPPANNFSSQTFFGPYLTNVPNHSHLSEFQRGHLSMPEHHQAPLPVGYSLQPFAGTNLIDFPSSSYAQASSVNHPFSNQQPQMYSLQYPAPSENLPGNTMASTTKLLSDILEKNQMSSLPETKIPIHYNPYASTFDQPLSSKFSSSSFRQVNDTPSGNKYDASTSLSHHPVDGLGAGSIGSRQMSSSNSAKVVPTSLPMSGGDQYDPLLDSIEKSQKSLGNYDRVQKWDSTNDEFGETADAEVGAVENDSPSGQLDLENTSAGEIEIDQSKSPGKRKKSKDSKSMKLFRIAIADFVKEVLKPSWRQGNMSKEAFKTIVKKTVDKVSGAMKGHQAPKSEAKINQYIDSSQRKLTKLVMGYVDKYVKM